MSSEIQQENLGQNVFLKKNKVAGIQLILYIIILVGGYLIGTSGKGMHDFMATIVIYFIGGVVGFIFQIMINRKSGLLASVVLFLLNPLIILTGTFGYFILNDSSSKEDISNSDNVQCESSAYKIPLSTDNLEQKLSKLEAEENFGQLNSATKKEIIVEEIIKIQASSMTQ